MRRKVSKRKYSMGLSTVGKVIGTVSDLTNSKDSILGGKGLDLSKIKTSPPPSAAKKKIKLKCGMKKK